MSEPINDQSQLTAEDREILANFDLIENMEILENLDEIEILDESKEEVK
jgi:hypothetical protein